MPLIVWNATNGWPQALHLLGHLGLAAVFCVPATLLAVFWVIDLVRVEGAWKVTNWTWSVETAGCPETP